MRRVLWVAALLATTSGLAFTTPQAHAGTDVHYRGQCTPAVGTKGVVAIHVQYDAGV
jgi:hypothetical protein